MKCPKARARAVPVAIVLVGLVALAGCGGGGKSVAIRVLGDVCPVASNPGTINYSTNWGGAPLNASQVLRIIDANGNVVRTNAINRDSAGSSALSIESITPGVYEFKSTLFSLANAGGTMIGETSQVVDLCGNTATVRTTNALPAVSVKMSQNKLNTVEQRATRLVATALAATGEAVFVADGSFGWSVLGGVGTVDQAGLFNATTAGSGSVRAVLTGPNKRGATAVNVEAFVITQTKWTVMVYINAANDLFFASDLNVNQMETVADNPEVRFVLQWKQTQSLFGGSSFDGVRRYLVKHDTTNSIASELVQANLTDGLGSPLDMGKAQTLLDFVNWTKTFYPADRYVLIIWNHGNGWRRAPGEPPGRAFSYDDETGSSIQLWEADEALGTNHLDIIAWDASLMQMMEVAYEVRDNADYAVGSEESPPAEGYPYDLVFAHFRDNPDDTTANLTKAFVDGMLANPAYVSRKITQSSVDTSKLVALRDSLSTLATALDANKSTIQALVQDARDTSQSYSQTTSRYFRDAFDLCLRLEAEPGMPAAVVTAAADVRAKIAAAVIWEGHNGNSPNSHGIAVDFSPMSTFVADQSDYAQLKFAMDSVWDEWLAVAP